MSKKQPGKKTVKKAVKKAPARKTAPAKTAAPAKRALAAPTADKKSSAATIFVYKVNGDYRVRTAPQLLGASPGYVEWTVVNLASDDEVDVEITWPAGGPWGGAAMRFKGNERKSLADAKPGRYKYNVTVNGYTEDPELEFPVN